MKKCLACLLLALPGIAAANDVCGLMENFAEQMNAALPQALDQQIELTRVDVDCRSQTLTYNKRLLVPGEVRSEVREHQQTLHTRAQCGEQGFVASVQWTAADAIHDVDSNYLFSLTTRPEDC